MFSIPVFDDYTPLGEYDVGGRLTARFYPSGYSGNHVLPVLQRKSQTVELEVVRPIKQFTASAACIVRQVQPHSEDDGKLFFLKLFDRRHMNEHRVEEWFGSKHAPWTIIVEEKYQQYLSDPKRRTIDFDNVNRSDDEKALPPVSLKVGRGVHPDEATVRSC